MITISILDEINQNKTASTQVSLTGSLNYEQDMRLAHYKTDLKNKINVILNGEQQQKRDEDMMQYAVAQNSGTSRRSRRGTLNKIKKYVATYGILGLHIGLAVALSRASKNF